MSYCLHPYAVEIAALEKAIGSKDKRLLKSLRKKFRGDFPEIDELDEDASPVEKALEDLVGGVKPDEDSAFKYGYALDFLCEHLGAPLPNRHWSAMGWDWIEEVDKSLTALGVPAERLRIDPHLTTRGAPVKLPEIDDFPAIGYLKLAEIEHAFVALSDLEKVDDEEVRESLEELRSWLVSCRKRKRDLVCFYY